MPLDLFSPLLNYAAIDGIGRARQRGVTPNLDGQTFRADAIGPILELENVKSGLPLDTLRQCSWFDQSSSQSFLNALSGRPSQWLSTDRTQGFISAGGLSDETTLTSFKIDAHKGALDAGFGRASGLFVAALGELIGNVVDHSADIDSGVALFTGSSGQFEMVVSDRGVGALRSLQQNANYKQLSDDGAALQAMVEPNVSRFGDSIGHGNGFRPIFEKLADMTGSLRFRSGGYVLTLDGRFGDKVARQVSQRPYIHGFFASVHCSARQVSTT